jgi:hypothetical protein
MALTITAVPDIKYVLGESGRFQAYDLKPSTSDYVTGGYPITASAVELGKLVGAKVMLTNAAGIAYGASFVGTTPLTQPQTQLNLYITSAGSQVAASTDLSGCEWSAIFLGW